MYNNFYYSLSIRGHHPLNEKFDYYHPENNIPITDRDSSWLDKEDWTHLIVNNTFGSCYDANDGGSSHVVIFYNMPPEDPPGQGEDVYFPPRNVTIANNVFIDKGSIRKKPISIYAKRGINTGEVWSVDRVYVLNNVTDQSTLIIEEDYPIESIDQSSDIVNAAYINFVDKTEHDYRLTQASTDLINKGTLAVSLVPNNDFLRQGRDDFPDVGAYEYHTLPTVQQKIPEKKNELKIYPNPASGHIRVDIPKEFRDYHLVIYDSLAREVNISLPKNSQSRHPEINIQNLSRGIYICRIYDQKGNKLISGKFIISR
jgi:hypothetical protein